MIRLFNGLLALAFGFAAFGLAAPAEASNVRICNKVTKTFYVASFWKAGPLSCALSGQDCIIASSGWLTLEPQRCVSPKIGIFRETRLAIVSRDAQNRLDPAEFGVNRSFLSRTRGRGSSGLTGQNACVKRGNFSRSVQGNWSSAFNKPCPSGYLSLPLSLAVRSAMDGTETINIR